MANTPNLRPSSDRILFSRRSVVIGGAGLVTVSAVGSALGQIIPKLRCRNSIELYNLGPPSPAFSVQVIPRPGTKIEAANAPAGWNQTFSQSPNRIDWKPASNGAIPLGAPISDEFWIEFEMSGNPEKEVTLHWLNANGRILCSQDLQIDCFGIAEPDGPRVPVPGERTPQPRLLNETQPQNANLNTFCMCLFAVTEMDENSEFFADPDVEVELGQPVTTGFLKVKVPYTLELEPANLPITLQWLVTVEDEFGESQPIVVPFTDDQINREATFCLPGPGEYEFSLEISQSQGCQIDPSGGGGELKDSDEITDTDEASAIVTHTTSAITLVENVDPCDPRIYEFRDDTVPAGINPVWKVIDPVGDETFLNPQGSVVTFNFPTLGDTYSVCFTAEESDGSVRPEICQPVTPVEQSANVGFEYEVDCPDLERPVNVVFNNLSTSDNCPVSWEWNFGDNSATSTDESPVHQYSTTGSYTVTLKMTNLNTNMETMISRLIVLDVWEPNIIHTLCPDGSVILENTNAKAPINIFEPDSLDWDTPGGDLPVFFSHRKEVKVCYQTTGTKTVTVTGTKDDPDKKKRQRCTKTITFDINSIVIVCPKDKLKKIERFFTYDGDDYRTRTWFKFHGKFPGRISAKVKLRVQKSNGGWKRKRASEISVKITGDVIKKDNAACFTNTSALNIPEKSRNKKSKVKKRHFPSVGSFRVAEDQIKAEYFVKIDSNHAGETANDLLWENTCGGC